MSRIVTAYCLIALGCVIASPVVRAEEGPIHWHLMGGYSAPVDTTADYLRGGFLIGGGFSVTPVPGGPLDLRFDLSYSRHQASNRLLDLAQQSTHVEIDDGSGSFWSGTGNLVFHVPLGANMRGYAIAGAGAYHTRVELTQFAPFGYGYDYYDCDPFSGFCYGGANAVVASSSVTKFGWNAGVGIEFRLPYRQAWFIEARYHRINTDTPIEFVPITIGYRF